MARHVSMLWEIICGPWGCRMASRESLGFGEELKDKVFPLGAVAGVGLCRGRKIFQKEEFRNYRCYGS